MITAIIGEDQFTKDKCIERFLEDALGDLKDDPMSRQILFATDSNIPSIADAVITACDSVSIPSTNGSRRPQAVQDGRMDCIRHPDALQEGN